MTTMTHSPDRPATTARYWHTIDDGRVQCDLCPRLCRLREGQRGFCFVRQNVDGFLVLTTYGRSSGFCVDPIEKKPLNHVMPGQSVLSFGTAGCNLGCKFCQNWEISTARTLDPLQEQASPTQIAEAALRIGSRGVAYTYNDPIIFTEYAIDVAEACHDRGLINVAVTAGYVTDEARRDFFSVMDAANVDLKSFNPDFYRRVCGGQLDVVLDTLMYIAHETTCWLEITTLVVPGLNDSDAEIHELSAWITGQLGPDTPLHLTAFHPDNRMRDIPRTPLSTLKNARRIAMSEGLKFVYTGNVVDPEGSTTCCPGCALPVITRRGYDVTGYDLDSDGRCTHCNTPIPGRWDEQVGHFGNRRIPVDLTP
ncbi:MAG: AmmeMemoRadiSam system radical SAM enzyme [Propionibacteriaceae bacterium]|nr:AmmeMemoRadiSam system radical SAM enzyme [Propionibacteriaceae bacterium]